MSFLLRNKFKETPPLDTVYEIRNILHGLGISTIDKWTDSKVDGCYSLRVEIAGTGMGQNGKGATSEFALASAYAELMERIQNDLLYSGDYDEEVWKHCGFYYAPDERLMGIKELAREDNPWVDKLLDIIRHKDEQIKPGSGMLGSLAARLLDPDGAIGERYALLKRWSFAVPRGCGHDFVAIPFCSLRTGDLYYMPVSILRAIYGSNGTCAGNTREEALLQGLSELFERHANVRIITERLTPPTIPEWYLRRYERLYGIIRQIESKGNYKLIIKDCSLDSGFPVIASVLINLDARAYVVKFGAHPVFEIALERTLTEMFQGRDISTAAQVCRIANGFEQVGGPDNLHNILKVASGQYPEQFFSEKYSYEFTPFNDHGGETNGELLEYAISQLAGQGHEIMIRDVSYLGFHSFQIVVPGYSEIFNFGTQRLREKSTLDVVKNIIRKLPEASEEDVQKLVRYMSYKRNWALENSLEFSAGLPLKPDFPGGQSAWDFLLAACYYRLGKYNEAYRGFGYVAARMKSRNDANAAYYACLRDYAGALTRGIGDEKAIGFLNKFYTCDIWDQVMRHAGEPREILKRLYTSLNCFNCQACHASSRCSYDAIRKMRMRLKEKQLENRIDQRKQVHI
ncbi:YcaO-like family protein [Desulfoscipio sp. XC116]|uniref:YcaO-like family protein n=1 Tax=Desulfoscipio sp. XC116 TaxID=3144975 RepID=UPI00325B4938